MSSDEATDLWLGVRLQTRWSNSRITQDALPAPVEEEDSELKLNRGRIKGGGTLLDPRLDVYSEADFTDQRLLDLRMTWQFSPALYLRLGQWKADYNRERIDSSGKQQFVERSVATPWFTVDRQQGIVASGRLAKGSGLDSNYWFGWLSGSGRGGELEADNGLWMGRYQWNIGGRKLAFSQSDIKRHNPGAGSVALGLVHGKSSYTSFSSAGGGQLPGFTTSSPGRYRIDQAMLETAWQQDGFSWQQELHWKRIEDRQDGGSQSLVGGYAQVGYFPGSRWQLVPAPLELALRCAYVDPNRSDGDDYERELTVAANWFFNGHRNKLTADYSHVRRREVPESDTSQRLRLQWEFSF
ncbi:porin [Candidatus Litorirhabdus singularis]|uniref:porin n=1 Tax=Candidatus Litorirhabdus singularis TaxID=2518993 RepID=UPI00242D3C1D|nr:porin [Candidatus Litorirhabdus singularis]